MKTVKVYRVHSGYTRKGANRWLVFDTLEQARAAAEEIHNETGTVVAIEEWREQ